MTDPINTHNRVRNSGVSADSRTGATTKTNQQSSETARSNATSESAIVELSNASLLEQLGDQIKNQPEVNEARVAAVKQALSSGEYQPDAEIIARKYSEIEKLLP